MRPTRTLNDKEKFPRTPNELPREVSAEVLCNPKTKVSGPFRRTMLRSRASVIEYPRTRPLPYTATVGRFIASRSIVQLRRLLPRYRRAISAINEALDYVNKVLETSSGDTRIKLLALKKQHELALFDAKSHFDACQNEAKRRATPVSKS